MYVFNFSKTLLLSLFLYRVYSETLADLLRLFDASSKKYLKKKQKGRALKSNFQSYDYDR